MRGISRRAWLRSTGAIGLGAAGITAAGWPPAIAAQAAARKTRLILLGTGGGPRVAEEYGVPLLAQLPLDPDTRKGGDEGAPITVRRPDSPQAQAFHQLAARVIERLDAVAALRPLPSIS